MRLDVIAFGASLLCSSCVSQTADPSDRNTSDSGISIAAAQFILSQTRDVFGGSRSSRSGFHLRGSVVPGDPNVPPIPFDVRSFPDGYVSDSEGAHGTIHTEAKWGSIKESTAGKVASTKAKQWSPSLDYFPIHGWWQNFGEGLLSAKRLSLEEIDSEQCEHLHLVLKLPTQFVADSEHSREEDLYIGSTSHLIRQISYISRNRGDLSHGVTVTLQYSDFRTFESIPIATKISRSINGHPVAVITISEVTKLSGQSVLDLN